MSNRREFLKQAAASGALVWGSAKLAAQEKPELWGTLLFWMQGIGNIMRMSNERALANGLTTRPVSDRLGEALQWVQAAAGREPNGAHHWVQEKCSR